MGWDNVGYAPAPSPDDIAITDAQTRELRRLCEKKDNVPTGTYAELTWEMTRIDASRRIDQLKSKVGEA